MLIYFFICEFKKKKCLLQEKEGGRPPIPRCYVPGHKDRCMKYTLKFSYHRGRCRVHILLRKLTTPTAIQTSTGGAYNKISFNIISLKNQ